VGHLVQNPLSGREHAAVDAKTGQESPTNAVQAMIYRYSVPRALERYRTPSYEGLSPTQSARCAFQRTPWTTNSSRTWARCSAGSQPKNQLGLGP